MSTTGLKDAPCTAKIRPFPDDTELTCFLDEHGVDMKHWAILKDYAGPNTSSDIYWFEDDRRTFRGDWIRCPHEICTLPKEHSGHHAY